MLLIARDAEATRLGSRALFYSSALALFVNIAAPMFIATAPSKRSHSITHSHSSSSAGETALGALGDGIGSARVGGNGGLHENAARSGWRKHREGGWRESIKVPEGMKFKLVSLWAVSHLVLGVCLLGTL
jgi:solute carrier family 45 protein 1/2/4